MGHYKKRENFPINNPIEVIERLNLAPFLLASLPFSLTMICISFHSITYEINTK